VVHGLRTQDIEFIDIIQYDPRQMAAPPYRLRITTKLPSAGDRVCPHSITSKGSSHAYSSRCFFAGKRVWYHW